MDSDKQQFLDHPPQGAYLVKLRFRFHVRCEQHRDPSGHGRVAFGMPRAIALMQRHNARHHS